MLEPATEQDIADPSPTSVRKGSRQKSKTAVSPELIDQTVLDWPWLFLQFNRFNSSYQDFATMLKRGKPYEPVLFDRSVVSVMVWVALLFGTSLVFFWFSEEDVENEEKRRQHEAESAVEEQIRIRKNYEEIWKKKEAGLNQAIREFGKKWQQEEQKVKGLQAKLEYQAPQVTGLPVQIQPKEELPKGVLDSDLL